LENCKNKVGVKTAKAWRICVEKKKKGGEERRERERERERETE